MRDLFGVSSQLIRAVNPLIPAILRMYDGDDGSREQKPKYRDIFVDIDVQSLSGDDFLKLEKPSEISCVRAVYIRGRTSPRRRAFEQNGDVLIFNNCQWRITQLLEEWGNCEWKKVAVMLQDSLA